MTFSKNGNTKFIVHKLVIHLFAKVKINMKQKMTNFNNKNKRANTEPRAISPQKCTIYK